MDSIQYVETLLELNSEYMTAGQMPETKAFNMLAWGLLEEYDEWSGSTTLEAETKEAGDTIAYATLLLCCVLTKEEVAKLLDDACQDCNDLFDKGEYYSNLKRVNRENEPFNYKLVLPFVSAVLEGVHSLTFEHVAEVNIQKLRDRKQRGVMFSGSGDNR